MKKLLLNTAAAVMLFAGCSRDEVIDLPKQDQPTPVGFATYVGNAVQTKGECLDIETVKEKHFGVYAFYQAGTLWNQFEEQDKTTPNFMNNVEVYWDENLTDPEDNLSQASSRMMISKTTYKWNYKDTKYWPVEKDEEDNYYRGPVHFFAYAPYVEDLAWKGSEGKLSFTLDKDVKKLVDMVYSANYIKRSEIAGEMQTSDEGDDNLAILEKLSSGFKINRANGGYVRFRFAHALSRISFSAEVDAPNRKVVITEITVGEETNGFYASGDFKLGVVPSMGNLLAHTNNNLENTVQEGESDDVSGSALEPLNFWDVTNQPNDATFSLTAEGGNFIADNILSAEPKQINAEDSYLFVIPQDFTQEDTYLPITIKYTVTETDENGKETSTSYNIDGRIKHKFLQGKAYRININLNGGGGLNAVLFAVVDDFTWENSAEENPTTNMQYQGVLSLLQ